MTGSLFGLENIVIIAALLIGSVFDYRSREIPDLLSFSLIAIGLAIGLVRAILGADTMIFAWHLIGLAAAAVLGLILYYLGQWGGGDAKIVMGVGAVIGLNPASLSSSTPALGLFFLNAVFVGAFYGVLWIIVLALRNFSVFRKNFRDERTKKRNLHFRKLALIFYALLMIAVLAIPLYPIYKIFLLLVLFFMILMLYAIMFIHAVENGILVKNVDVSKLTEGDWIVGKVKLKNGRLLSVPKTGISEQEIKILFKNKIRQVTVKEGIPFVPSFLISYVLVMVLGNWIMLIASLVH